MVAQAINEKTRWQKASDIVLSLQQNIFKKNKSSGRALPFSLTAPHRRYIREGNLYSLNKTMKWTKCYAFLFTDILLLTTPRNDPKPTPSPATTKTGTNSVPQVTRQFDLKCMIYLNRKTTIEDHPGTTRTSPPFPLFSSHIKHDIYIIIRIFHNNGEENIYI
jgi:hypothetical protein